MYVPLILERRCPAAKEVKHKVFKAAEITFPLAGAEVHSFVSFHQQPNGEWEPCGEMLALQELRSVAPAQEETGNGKSPK